MSENPPVPTTLWSVTRGERLRYFAAIVAMGCGQFLIFMVPMVLKGVIDRLTQQGDQIPWLLSEPTSLGFELGWSCACIVVLTACGGGLIAVRGVWAARASEGIVRRLRQYLQRHLQRLPCATLDGADTGDLVQRCTSDVDTMRLFLSAQVVEMGRVTLLLATAIPLMYSISPSMTGVSVLLFPVIIVAATLFFRRIRTLFQSVDEAEGGMTAALQENLTGVRVVRAFARQEYESEQFGQRNRRHRDLHQRLITLLGTYWACSNILCFSQIGLVLGVGASQLSDGVLTAGALVAFLQYEWLMIWPVRHLGRVLMDSGKALVALRRLRTVLLAQEESDIDAGEEQPASAVARGALEVSGLSFRYPALQAFADGDDDEGHSNSRRDERGEASTAAEVGPVLDDISFALKPGGTLAILGPPGAGKTTLLLLLLRLYDYSQGSIQLDGVELKGMGRAWVRSQMAAVLQQPFLFSQSIAANLRVGRRLADAAELRDATESAAIHQSIEEFPRGFDTLVGERGITLSGGQRQRLALARALLKNPPLLILDDALSAVDTETEHQILAALRDRHGDKTTIIVAHRLSAISHADEILYLDRGRIVQRGRHQELVQQSGPYQRLWQLQTELEGRSA